MLNALGSGLLALAPFLSAATLYGAVRLYGHLRAPRMRRADWKALDALLARESVR